MRKGLISIGILAGFLLSILMVSGVSAQKDVVPFNVSTGKVTLNHKKHAETSKIECLKCHHTWKKGETTGKLCHECHKAQPEGKALSAKEAFHKTCQDCHKKDKEAKKTAGPTTCFACHIKPPVKK